jgi:hypothetical protein
MYSSVHYTINIVVTVFRLLVEAGPIWTPKSLPFIVPHLADGRGSFGLQSLLPLLPYNALIIH